MVIAVVLNCTPGLRAAHVHCMLTEGIAVTMCAACEVLNAVS